MPLGLTLDIRAVEEPGQGRGGDKELWVFSFAFGLKSQGC